MKVLITLFLEEELYFSLLAITSKAPGLNDYALFLIPQYFVLFTVVE